MNQRIEMGSRCALVEDTKIQAKGVARIDEKGLYEVIGRREVK